MADGVIEVIEKLRCAVIKFKMVFNALECTYVDLDITDKNVLTCSDSKAERIAANIASATKLIYFVLSGISVDAEKPYVEILQNDEDPVEPVKLTTILFTDVIFKLSSVKILLFYNGSTTLKNDNSNQEIKEISPSSSSSKKKLSSLMKHVNIAADQLTSSAEELLQLLYSSDLCRKTCTKYGIFYGSQRPYAIKQISELSDEINKATVTLQEALLSCKPTSLDIQLAENFINSSENALLLYMLETLGYAEETYYLQKAAAEQVQRTHDCAYWLKQYVKENYPTFCDVMSFYYLLTGSYADTWGSMKVSDCDFMIILGALTQDVAAKYMDCNTAFPGFYTFKGIDSGDAGVPSLLISMHKLAREDWHQRSNPLSPASIATYITRLEQQPDYFDCVFAMQGSLTSSNEPVWSFLQEWVSRVSRASWPTNSAIENCQLYPVYYVAAGHPARPNQQNQVRLSFSAQERYLCREQLNSIQGQCLVLLKICIKFYLGKEIEDCLLKSYHAKTTLFWTLERTPLSFWDPQSSPLCLLSGFRACLTQLNDFLMNDNLPNYFIMQQNLLYPFEKFSAQKMAMLNLIKVLLNDPISIFSHIYLKYKEEITVKKSMNIPSQTLISIHKFLQEGLQKYEITDEKITTITKILHDVEAKFANADNKTLYNLLFDEIRKKRCLMLIEFQQLNNGKQPLQNSDLPVYNGQLKKFVLCLENYVSGNYEIVYAIAKQAFYDYSVKVAIHFNTGFYENADGPDRARNVSNLLLNHLNAIQLDKEFVHLLPPTMYYYLIIPLLNSGSIEDNTACSRSSFVFLLFMIDSSPAETLIFLTAMMNEFQSYIPEISHLLYAECLFKLGHYKECWTIFAHWYVDKQQLWLKWRLLQCYYLAIQNSCSKAQ